MKFNGRTQKGLNMNFTNSKNRVIEILKAHGIEMSVAGCGCCGSPYVSFKYKGEFIIKNEENFCFDTETET